MLLGMFRMDRIRAIRDGVPAQDLPEDIPDLTEGPILDLIALLGYDSAVRKHERDKAKRGSKTIPKGRRR